MVKIQLKTISEKIINLYNKKKLFKKILDVSIHKIGIILKVIFNLLFYYEKLKFSM